MSGLASAVDLPSDALEDPVTGRHPSLGWFVRREVRRVFSRPYDELLTCAANVVLVCIGWFLLPKGLKDWLFELHGRQAFPVVLCIWMLADTPATNVLGSDPDLALRVLDSRRLLRRFLWAKHLVLMAVVVPVCATGAVVLGLERDRNSLIVFGCVLIAIVPIGTLVVSTIQGVLLPYHQLPVRWRWEHRDRRLMQLRWAALLLLPYVTVPFIAGAIVSPSIGVIRAMTGAPVGMRYPSPTTLILAAAVAAAMSLVFVVVGERLTWRVVRWQRGRLAAFLRNAQRG